MPAEIEDLDVTRVLIVDDHDLTHSGLKLVIGPPSYQIIGNLKSGVDVIPFLGSEAADVVLLDLGLPDVDGLTLLAELVAVHDATVIVLSGSGDPTEFASAVKLGARAVISKSDDNSVILQAVGAVRRGEQFISPHIASLFQIAGQHSVSLSPRQMAILHFLAAGETNKEIGYRLRIAAPTVSFHLREIREKLGVDSNRKIVEEARSCGLL